MTVRLSLDPSIEFTSPIVHPAPNPLWHAPVMDPTSPECIALTRQAAELDSIFRTSMARADADAAEYGEPTSEEFWHGWPTPERPAKDRAEIAAWKGDLCPDCPPFGYPTDKTRCEECPRRATTADEFWHGRGIKARKRRKEA